jgi:hypothetical protein
MHEAGLLRHLIVGESSRESFAKIEEILESHRIHEILPIARGLFTASPSQAPDSITGFQNVWIRDNVMVANSFRLRGQLAPAIACMKGLTLLLETQRPRFHDIIADVTGALKEDANRRPHIRFTAQSLGELPEKWPHAQNDALGHALWFRFLLANEGSLPLTAEDYEVFRLFRIISQPSNSGTMKIAGRGKRVARSTITLIAPSRRSRPTESALNFTS